VFAVYSASRYVERPDAVNVRKPPTRPAVQPDVRPIVRTREPAGAGACTSASTSTWEFITVYIPPRNVDDERGQVLDSSDAVTATGAVSTEVKQTDADTIRRASLTSR
jgi:hypothetical protein